MSVRTLFLLFGALPTLPAQVAPPIDCARPLAEDFVPMTLSERLANGARGVLSPSAFVFPALLAGVTQADDRPAEWGQGVDGFAHRYWSGYAGRFIGQSVEHGLALALHEDNRYFASGSQNTRYRIGYALSSTFLARHDDGSRHFSYSAIGGAAAGSFLVRPWQPRSTGSASDAAISLGLTMAFRMGLNVAREFGPPIVGKFLR